MDNQLSLFFQKAAETFPLDSEKQQKLCLYAKALVKWNRTINIVGKAPLREILIRHFLDSLYLLPYIKGERLLDIGSGGGFPGLVIKIARPELQVTLVEPRQKRCSFLRQIIRELSLDNITVHELHLADSNPDHINTVGTHDTVTSRAFTDISNFLRLAAPFCKPEGRALCMKGPKAVDELHAWQQTKSPFQLVDQHPYALPEEIGKRVIVVFRRKEEGK